MNKEDYYQSAKVKKIDTLEPWILQVEKLIQNSNNKLLDVGCGEGSYSACFKKNGGEVWGIELSEKAALIAKAQIHKVVVQDAETSWDVPSEYFDIVTMLRYLEHVFDYNNQLQQCRRVLKKSGQLLIYSPNMSIVERCRLLLGRVPSYAADIEHIRQFTKPYLFQILKQNGFRPVHCEGYKFVIPILNCRLRIVERLSPNSCPGLFIRAIKV